LYLGKNYSQAVSTLQQVDGDGASNAQASFWLGKSLQQLGQTARAEDAWKNAETLDPYGYYGARAAQLLSPNALTSASPPSQVVNTSLSSSQQSALATWYAAQGTTASATRASVLNDAGYQRMSHLFALGLTEQANWELSAFADRNSHDLPALSAIGQLLLESDQYNAAYRVGLAMENDATAMKVTLPDALERLAYPLAYPQLVAANASESKVDPLLFLALIRQESGYNPSVTSSAGARGLAQIVPDTASVLADALDVKGWNDDQLFRPYVGVRFGTVYLADRMTKFDGNVEEALAAYNAGDGNAADWAAQANSDDPDVFEEEIPFTETYAYVQTVYANYLTYVRLYR
jgi:soluble lytic murein transglycosylase